MSSGDRLLHVASARREVSWSIFKAIFDAFASEEDLNSTNAAVDRAAFLRILDSLGHVEVLETAEGRRIAVAPSSLVRLPTEQPVAVFAGSRSLEALDQIREAAKSAEIRIEVREHSGRLAGIVPQRISAQAATEDSLAEYAHAVGVAYQPSVVSWALARFSAGIDDALNGLRWETSAELNWPHVDFHCERARFARPENPRPEYRLTRYLDPIKGIRRYWLWDGLSWAEMDGDWGRYAALRKSGFSVLYFDRSSNLLGVPRSVPMPRLLARALALCSGYAPCVPRKSPGNTAAGLDVYRFVPKAIADLIALKLGQDISNCVLEL